jgi:hypothetical protein
VERDRAPEVHGSRKRRRKKEKEKEEIAIACKRLFGEFDERAKALSSSKWMLDQYGDGSRGQVTPR